MKRLITAFCAIILTVVLGFTVVGCNKADIESLSPSTSKKILHNDIHYLASTVVKQAGGEEDEASDKGYEYITSQKIDNLMFIQFRIGKILNCFIQNVTTPVYNDSALTKLEYTSGAMTSTTVSEGISKSISTTQSISVTESKKETISWKISESTSTTGSLGINVSVFSLTAGISKTFTHAAEVGKTTEESTSQTIAESVANTTNKDFDVSELNQSFNQTSYEFDMSLYEEGYYYALSLVADIDVYQIVAYDISINEFYTAYFATCINSNNASLKMLASENASFDIKNEYQISPITELGVDEIIGTGNNNVDLGNTEDFFSGFGTSEYPYLIASSEHLQNVSKFPEAKFRIISDINVDASTFVSIPKFLGELNGGNFIINFRNTRSVNFCRIGDAQFGGVIDNNSGIVKNLIISGLNFQSAKDYHGGNFKIAMGGVVGINHESGIIENVIVTGGNYTSDRNNSAFGTICGINHGKVLSCSANDVLIYTTGDGGGIVGYQVNGSVIGCTFTGELGMFIANDNGVENLRSYGAIVGYSNNSTISNCNVNKISFKYYGESESYHKYFLWFHSYCNLQIRTGLVCGMFVVAEAGTFSDNNYDMKKCPQQLILIGGNFHYGSHEKQHLFANMDGMIGYLL